LFMYFPYHTHTHTLLQSVLVVDPCNIQAQEWLKCHSGAPTEKCSGEACAKDCGCGPGITPATACQQNSPSGPAGTESASGGAVVCVCVLVHGRCCVLHNWMYLILLLLSDPVLPPFFFAEPPTSPPGGASAPGPSSSLLSTPVSDGVYALCVV
jgi:hypothetical protein